MVLYVTLNILLFRGILEPLLTQKNRKYTNKLRSPLPQYISFSLSSSFIRIYQRTCRRQTLGGTTWRNLYIYIYIYIYILYLYMLETIDVCIPALTISVCLLNFPRSNSPSAGCALATNETSYIVTTFFIKLLFFRPARKICEK